MVFFPMSDAKSASNGHSFFVGLEEKVRCDEWWEWEVWERTRKPSTITPPDDRNCFSVAWNTEKKTCSFSSPASRKKKNYMLKNEAIAPQLCKIIWSLSDRWLNPRACPPQAMYMIIRFTNSEIVNIPHASLSHSLTILSSLFFSIYERKLKLRGRLVWMFVTVPWLMNNLLLILSLCILFYRRSAYKYVVYSQRSQQARQQQQLPPLRYALHPNTFS